MCDSDMSKPDRLLGVVVPFVEGVAEKHQASGEEGDVQRLNGISTEFCSEGRSESWVWSTSSSQVLLLSFSSIIADSKQGVVAFGCVVYP